MSYGIRARYARCKLYWARHLAICKELQAELWQRVPTGSSVAVLGAGQLIDLDIAALKKHAGKVTLYDADPSLRRVWGRALRGHSHESKVLDLTGRLQDWSLVLAERLADEPGIEEVAECLRALPLRIRLPLKISSQAIISLNVLSQLPIYWRDRVAEMLRRHAGIESDEHGRYAEPLHAALTETMAVLQREHLELLKNSDARWVLLSTDVNFMYYVSSHSNWQVEPALHFRLPEPPLEEAFDLLKRDSCLWHIAPQGIEETKFGAIHEVQAWLLERRDNQSYMIS